MTPNDSIKSHFLLTQSILKNTIPRILFRSSQFQSSNVMGEWQKKLANSCIFQTKLKAPPTSPLLEIVIYKFDCTKSQTPGTPDWLWEPSCVMVNISLTFWKEAGQCPVFRPFTGLVKLRSTQIGSCDASLPFPQPNSESLNLFPDHLEQGVVFLMRNALLYSLGLPGLSDST